MNSLIGQMWIEDSAILAARIESLVRRACFSVAAESGVQAGIAEVLRDAGIPFAREVALGDGDRIDFLCDRLGIEVKVDGSISEVTRQLWRYAQRPEIDALMLVTVRAKHIGLPREINGKSVRIVVLLRGLA